jgi:hypothetical protein
MGGRDQQYLCLFRRSHGQKINFTPTILRVARLLRRPDFRHPGKTLAGTGPELFLGYDFSAVL